MPASTNNSPSVIAVTDRPTWADRAVRASLDTGARFERWTWSDAGRLDRLPDAIVLDLSGPFPEKLQLLEEWANRAWQPVCLVALSLEQGSSEVGRQLGALGYLNPEPMVENTTYEATLCGRLEQILGSEMRLLSKLLSELECSDPEVAAVLMLGNLLIGKRRTVESWVLEIGYPGRKALAQLLGGCGLAVPKLVFDGLRTVRMISHAERTRHRPSRDELASLVGYSSGDYAGKRMRDLWGLSLGGLAALGVDGTIALVAGRLRR
jgi:hypothetical protein